MFFSFLCFMLALLYPCQQRMSTGFREKNAAFQAAGKLDITTDLHYTNLDIDYDGKADADADAADTDSGLFCQLCRSGVPGWQTESRQRNTCIFAGLGNQHFDLSQTAGADGTVCSSCCSGFSRIWGNSRARPSLGCRGVCRFCD